MADAKIGSLYEQLQAKRAPYIERARESARLTIPSLMPPLGVTGARELEQTKQSLGARGVNNLASALLLALLPPNATFFRLQLTPEVEAELAGSGSDGLATGEIEKSLSQWEQAVVAEVERSGVRSPLYSALRQLLVVGNVVVYFRPEGGVRIFRLDSFVVRRDPAGKWFDLIIKERIRVDDLKAMLPKDVVERVMATEAAKDAESAEEPIEVYTRVQRKEGSFEKIQEIAGLELEETKETFSESENPYLIPRMIQVDGEDYGRSYVEEHRGDLASFEALRQAGVSGAMAATKHVIFVRPNGTTRLADIAQAPNLAVRVGNAEDVSVLSMNKTADLSFAENMALTLQNSLAQTFLLTEGGVRQAERVTAEEIRAVQASLERQLGGVYSLLSIELQLPMASHTMRQLASRGGLPDLPEELVEPVIVTGVQALGRAADSARLDELVAGLQQLLGPEAVARYMNPSELIARKCAALGIKSDKLVLSQEEVDARDAAARQAAAQDAAAGAAIDGAKQVAVDASRQATAA